jgi:hypothetical protein
MDPDIYDSNFQSRSIRIQDGFGRLGVVLRLARLIVFVCYCDFGRSASLSDVMRLFGNAVGFG